ncbi:MAG: proprotein convertase P-domain-containing protein, partial [Verrucomicrobiae bacterium]|nr:proprotein convertase P-domain-containing protein [Verrucomicrobiae bacterium]
MPPELSVPRNADADIDMYVTRSRDPRGTLYEADKLLLLETNALQYAYKSLTAGGSETVIFTNAVDGEVFYIGVKAEDQSAAEYGFFGISSPEPFSTIDSNGNQLVRGLRLPQAIPDGSPVAPGGTNIFAIAVYPMDIIQVIVSNSLYHEALGDLLGNLSHMGKFAVLNNHKSSEAAPDGFYSAVYDDTRSGEFPNSQTTDGPGTLDNFVGVNGAGAWILTMVDNAIGQTGYVQTLNIRLTPNLDLLAGAFVTLLPGQWRYAYVDVPPDASRMIISVTRLSAGPLELYARRGLRPTRTDYDARAILSPPGGELSISIYDDPPLRAGRYFIGAYNPNAGSISFYIYVRFERELPDVFRNSWVSTNMVSIGDLTLNVDTNEVTTSMVISDIKVGVRINHPRASDLDIRLVGPGGQSVLLSESRGGTNWTAFGAESVTTNFHHVALTYSKSTKTAALYIDGEPVRVKQCPELGPRLVTWGDLYFGIRPDITN